MDQHVAARLARSEAGRVAEPLEHREPRDGIATGAPEVGVPAHDGLEVLDHLAVRIGARDGHRLDAAVAVAQREAINGPRRVRAVHEYGGPVPTISRVWRSGASKEHSIAAVNPSPQSSQPDIDASTPERDSTALASTRAGGRPAAESSGARQ